MLLDQFQTVNINRHLPYICCSFPKEESELRRSILCHRFMWETGISGCDQLDDISVNMFGGYVYPVLDYLYSTGLGNT